MSREGGLYSEVNRCARCGKNHRSLRFHKFKRPVVDADGTVWEYWTICPRSQDPVMLRVVEASQQETITS